MNIRKTHMMRILIIGAGFSGVAVATRLLRQQWNSPVSIYLVNGNGRIARGMAYGTQSAEHVLNVPAGNMSAFEELPDDFVRFARTRYLDVTQGSFISRSIYGDYLESILNEAEHAAPPQVELKRIYHQVTSITPVQGETTNLIVLDSDKTLHVDKVVLALGHFPASRLPAITSDFYRSTRYIHDAWNQHALDSISDDSTVLLLGSGLTAVDTAMTLLNRNPMRTITVVSRRGLLPQAHRQTAGKPLGTGAESIWGAANTVRSQLREFRHYCRVLAEEGRNWREGLALLRPITADIWLAYPECERKRFLRHVQPYWDSHRHRLAPSVAQRFNTALEAGIVRPLAGRITGFNEDSNGVQVSLRPRGHEQIRVERTHYVVNCTGPCANPHHIDDALVQQLLADGMIRPDQLGLGIEVTPDCAVIAVDGQPSRSLFYIGPWLKAKYWEATAVPDLRVIARKLAARIIHDN